MHGHDPTHSKWLSKAHKTKKAAENEWFTFFYSTLQHLIIMYDSDLVVLVILCADVNSL